MPVQAASLPDTIDGIRPSIVAIGTYNPSGKPRQAFMGTGFVVNNGRQVVTNFHVLPKQLDLERKEALAVFSGRGRQLRHHPARVLAEDRQNDLALLQIESSLPAMALARSTQAREGDEIAFTGFPLGMVLGLYPVTHRGIVSAIVPMAQPQLDSKVITASMIRAMRNATQVLQLDATAYPGNSGSPVFLQDSGQVIGVINSVYVKRSREAVLSDPSGITYAIQVEHVHELIRRAANK